MGDGPLIKFRERIRREFKSGSNALLILHILASSPHPVYGYEIIHKLKTTSNNQINLGPGTIYPLLKHLEKQHFTTSFWGRLPGEPPGVPRKYYQLTPAGHQLYHHVLTDWHAMTHTINTILTHIKKT